jgi:DNA-directed RNA polymerase specialized sigma24 family protein
VVPKKHAYHRVTDEERNAMEHLRKEGWSDAEIGRRLGRNRQDVNRVLGPSGTPRGPVPVTTAEAVALLAKQGNSDEEIAQKFGLSKDWVRQLRNRGGIKYPTRVKSPSRK